MFFFRDRRDTQRRHTRRRTAQGGQPPELAIVAGNQQETLLQDSDHTTERAGTAERQSPSEQQQPSAQQSPPQQHPPTHQLSVNLVANQSTTLLKRPLPEKSPGDPSDDEDVEFLKGIGREARVWTTYVEEAKDFDDDMVDGWNRFVLESAKQLEPDKADETVAILREIFRTLQVNGAQLSATTEYDPTLGQEFQPKKIAVWVNCLWFLALSLSIAVSLAAILAKQWCYFYVAARNGDTITQAKERQKRHDGLEAWKTQRIMEHLPMFMHMALVASTVSAVSATALCFYIGTMLMPLLDTFCPYKTTQSAYIRIILVVIVKVLRDVLRVLLSHTRGALLPLINRIGRQITCPWLLHSNLPPNSRPDGSGHEPNIPASSHILDVHDGSPQPQRDTNADSFSILSNDEAEPFVKDALEWLICNSQRSNSIDTAIGALATGRVGIEAGDLKKQINIHLIKHISDCFTAGKDKTRLQLSHRHNALQSAWDYANWMSYFAGGTFENVTQQLLEFINDDTLEVELVIRLGLAFASLAEQKNPPSEASKNVAFWISALIRWYDKEKIYLSEEILSALVDGLTVAGHNVHILSAQERVQVLAGPHLINILWKISHIPGSKLRSSIGVNLAVLALTTNIPAHPAIDKQHRDAAAHNLVSQSDGNRDSIFISLALFALLGFIHPKGGVELDANTMDTACSIILETRYLADQDAKLGIPWLGDLDPLRRYLTSMLIEAMVNTSDKATVSSWENLVAVAFEDFDRWDNGVKFPSVLHAVCSLITSHLEKKVTLYPDTLRSAVDLLFREVQNLRSLDTTVLRFESNHITIHGPSTSQSRQAPTENDPQAHPTTEKTKEQAASSALALVMEKSNDKHCLETAVCAILTHTYHCDADLVMRAANWFEAQFKVLDENRESPNENQLLHMCGYVRILASMALHCTEPGKLATDLGAPDQKLHESVERKIKLLTTDPKDAYVHAFGVSGLAVWKFAAPDRFYDAEDTRDTLKDTWDLIIKYAVQAGEITDPAPRGNPLKHALLSEVIEVLVNTTTLLAAVTDPKCVITHPQARALLRLLGQHGSVIEGQVRLTLAVALAFWGLSLDEWDFWTPEMRRRCWREYTQSEVRDKDVAALFLVGLSRFLANYSALRLDHGSIKTIGLEIHRYMKKHTTHLNTLSLPFLSGFDVRRHVRESAWSYLQATESHGPFTKSTAESRDELRMAIQYDGGEGFIYEEPQPFVRRREGSVSTS
ncbi:hypothetical protein FRC12_002223 [Ceratobasidium sp. 428]|nr:hypothetical protein FRC12_002223 [Ceratobasidium sp. 428]